MTKKKKEMRDRNPVNPSDPPDKNADLNPNLEPDPPLRGPEPLPGRLDFLSVEESREVLPLLPEKLQTQYIRHLKYTEHLNRLNRLKQAGKLR